MNEGFQIIDIIFFAVIAGFILLRLRSALGRRTGHQPPPSQQRANNESNDNVVQLPDRQAEEDASDPLEPENEQPADELNEEDQLLAAGLAQITAADSGFTRQGFLDGAVGAFEIVIEAFAKGDADRLGDLLDEEVYRPFSRVIEERQEAGHSHQTTLVSIDENTVIEAGMNDRMAFVTVRFVSQQINVTYDAEGAEVGGDAAHVVTVTDLWTFERDTRSRSPNWKLVATRSPH